MEETWKPLPRDPRYLVSDQGNIRGPNGSLLRLTTIPRGYVVVHIAGRQFRVARLVLETFVGPCPPGHEARHLNGHPPDNRLVNLRWSTHLDNIRDKKVHGTVVHGMKIPWSVLTDEQVRKIVELVTSGLAQKEVGKQFGVPQSTVWKICRGHSWSHVTGIAPVAPGGKRGRSKVTDSQIEEMVALALQGVPQTEIASRFGLTQSGVSYRLTRLKAG